MAKDLRAGKSMLLLQNQWLAGINGKKIIELWQNGFEELADSFRETDPKLRISWAGPAMSARSSISARQMETWAHGQAVFDILGLHRQDQDTIKNIAHMGITTYGWSFVVNGEIAPEAMPYVELNAPSGNIWRWGEAKGGEAQENNRITGSATGFCQIVTQTRNIADTDIQTQGENARAWMALAQCFAGSAVKGPEPGQRYCMTN